mgnify:FL=1
MKISLFTAILLLFTSPVRANIDAIDGMYLVSPKGISQVSSSGAKDRHGNYTVEINVVESVYPRYYTKGLLIARGWWSTTTQQFYTEDYQIRPKLPHCNAFEEFSWGFPYEPTVVVIGNKKYPVYKKIPSFPEKRAPQKYCVDERVSRSTCRRDRCNKWESPKPNGYLVSSRSLANSLFADLRN